jgi:hypothetical protein
MTMQLADFMRLVDAYGADPERWPPERRAAALALAESDASADAALRQARALDERLDAAPGQAPSLALRTAVAGAALGAGRRRPVPSRSRPAAPVGSRMQARWAAAAALAIACAAGAVTGVAAATRQVQPAHVTVAADPAVDAGRLLAEPMDSEV